LVVAIDRSYGIPTRFAFLDAKTMICVFLTLLLTQKKIVQKFKINPVADILVHIFLSFTDSFLYQ